MQLHNLKWKSNCQGVYFPTQTSNNVELYEYKEQFLANTVAFTLGNITPGMTFFFYIQARAYYFKTNLNNTNSNLYLRSHILSISNTSNFKLNITGPFVKGECEKC